MGVLDWKHWAVLLVVALILFGGKRLKSVGSDLGGAIRGFRSAVKNENGEQDYPVCSQESNPIKTKASSS